MLPVEIIYLWIGALPLLLGLAYLWRQIRYARRQGETWRWWPPYGRFSAADNSVTLSPAQCRRPVLAGLGGGLALLLLGQIAYQAAPFPARWGVFVLMGAGGLLFLLGGRLAATRRLPGWIVEAARRLAEGLKIGAGQLPWLGLSVVMAAMAALTAGPKLEAYHGGVATVSWLAALGLALAGSWRQDEPEDDQKWTRWEVGFVAGVFILALALRAAWLTRFPDTLSGDEGSAGLTAVMFLEGKADNLFTLGWFSFPSLYFAAQSLGILILGQTTAALRITSAVSGALAVVAVYGLGRVTFDRVTAAIAAAYLAASHYHIHISRIGLNNVWDSLFAALALFGLWHGWQTGRRRSFLLAGLAVGIGQYFYASLRVLPLLFLIWGAAAFLWRRPRFRQRFAGLVLSLFVAAVAFAPLAVHFLRQPDEFQAPLQRVTIFNGWLDGEVAATGRGEGAIMMEQAAKAALGFTHTPLRLLYNPGAPLLLAGTAACFLLGILWLLFYFDLRALFLLLPLAATVVTGALSVDPPASQRYIMSMPVVALVLAIPLGQAERWLREVWSTRRAPIAAGLVVVVALLLVQDIHYYFFRVYDDYVLGGWNTETATQVAHYLRGQEVKGQKVYFFGLPRMGYYSLSTIPYLAPSMQGEDVTQPLTSPPSWRLDGPTQFIFLPERGDELPFVQQRYPGGTRRQVITEDGRLLFTAYTVRPDP